MSNEFNKDELLRELSLKHAAETNEHLEAIHGISSATLDELSKVEKSIKDIKIPEQKPDTETHKLLNNLIEEFKKPCDLSIKLILK